MEPARQPLRLGAPIWVTRTRVAVPARAATISAGCPRRGSASAPNDLFHDEDLAYAERLKAAGVPCDVEVVPGAFHGFDIWVAKSIVAQRFFDSQCTALGPGAPGSHIAK